MNQTAPAPPAEPPRYDFREAEPRWQREWEARGMSDMLRQFVRPPEPQPALEIPSEQSTTNPS